MFDLFGFKIRKTQKRYTQRKMKDGNMHVYDAYLSQWILWTMLSDYEQLALINVPIQEDVSDIQDPSRFNVLEDDLTESELASAAKSVEETIKDRQSESFGSSKTSILDDNSPSRSSGLSSGSSYDSGSNSSFGGGCSGSSGSSDGGSCGGGMF